MIPRFRSEQFGFQRIRRAAATLNS
jgi:hypothetical protein